MSDCDSIGNEVVFGRELLPLYETRLAMAKGAMYFYKSTYAEHGDEIAFDLLKLSVAQVSLIESYISKLKEPGSLVFITKRKNKQQDAP